MMGGGYFDNMWDPYSGAYAYPRTQPRARYYRPRAPVYAQSPVYDQHPAYEQRGSMQPENHFPGKVKAEDSGKTVRTIPVTDGSAPVEVKAKPVEAKAKPVEVKAKPVAVKVQPVVRFESEDAAARKIQAVYRGYSVRRTEPLKHLRVISKVREEFEGLKRGLEDREVRKRVAGNAQEKLRWTEGIMSLLLRLDQLQGVHPEVRVFRKAAAKELLMFQEKVDSMSDSVAEENVEDDVAEEQAMEDDAVPEEKSEVCDVVEGQAMEDDPVPEEKSEACDVAEGQAMEDDPVPEEKSEVCDVAEEKVMEVDPVAEEESEACDVAEKGAGPVAGGDVNASTAEALEEMEVEEVSVEDVNVEDVPQIETVDALVNVAPRKEIEQDAALLEEGKGEVQDDLEGALANGVPHEEMEQDDAPLARSKVGTQFESEDALANDAHPLTMEQCAAPLSDIKDREHTSHGANVIEGLSSEENILHEEGTNSEGQSGSLGDRIGESMVEDAEQAGLESEVPPESLDAQHQSKMAPAEMETGPVQATPVMDVDRGDVLGVEDAPPTDTEHVSLSKEADLVESTEINESHDAGTERLACEAERSELGIGVDTPPINEERQTTAAPLEPCESWMISASPMSVEARPCSAKSLQVGEPQISALGDTSSLSDRALLEQLLDENRKLKDVVGKVLHWGKQQNDIIHSLACRIEHLEENQSQANMLAGAQMTGRKRICNDGAIVGDRERLQRGKGRRKGRQTNRYQLGYTDSEWLSADSDEYF